MTFHKRKVLAISDLRISPAKNAYNYVDICGFFDVS